MTSPTQTSTESLLARRAEFVVRGLATAHPIAIARAEGTNVWDTEGKQYLDFACGIGALNVGHRHPRVIAAVAEQLTQLTHMSCQVAMYDPYVDVAERLSKLVGGPRRKALLVTTGSEATENAIKFARGSTNRPAVLAFGGGFHGRTLLNLTLNASNAGYRQNFGPFAPEIYHVPYPYEYRGWTSSRVLEEMAELFATRLAPSQIAAVIIEPQLGEGGFVPAPIEFMRALRDLTRQHGIVLIVDEIQSGFGRTGRMFAYEHSGIEPDIVTMAKGLAGGMPLAAVVGTAEIMDAPAPPGLGGTYAGNPLACAAALAVLDIFESEGLVERSARLGDILRDGLLALQSREASIGDVRGLGCMLAIELVRDRSTRTPDADLAQRVIDESRARGLLLLKCGAHKNVIRLLPPLVATASEVARATSVLDEAFAAARSN